MFIANFSNDVNDSSLGMIFMPFGNVVSAKVFIDKATGQSKGFGELLPHSVLLFS